MGLEPTDLVRINEEVVRVNWVRAITCQRIATSYGLDEPVCGTSVGLLLDSDEHQSCYATRPAHGPTHLGTESEWNASEPCS